MTPNLPLAMITCKLGPSLVPVYTTLVKSISYWEATIGLVLAKLAKDVRKPLCVINIVVAPRDKSIEIGENRLAATMLKDIRSKLEHPWRPVLEC